MASPLRQCSVDGCPRDHKARGFCLPHYKRFRRWGDPMGCRPTTPASERFASKVIKSGGCWEWTGGIGGHGYGVFHPVKGKSVLAHRYSYEAHKGAIPHGLHVDHLCRNRKCVNPGHLEAVTQEENSRRGLSYRLKNGMDNKCRNGHLYTPNNTYVEPNGYNVRCRECARERDRQPHRKASARRLRYAEQKEVTHGK